MKRKKEKNVFEEVFKSGLSIQNIIKKNKKR